MPIAQRYDTLIVGAGAAGCVLARRLSDRSNRTVALVEAGPDLRAPAPAMLRDGWRLPGGPDWPDWGFTAAPKADSSTPKVRRGRLLGGTSWLTRFAVRGAASDFDGWAAAGNPGWAFADVLPAFRRLETDLEYGAEDVHGSDGPLPITRYPGLHVSDIQGGAIEAMRAVGFAPIDDMNAPEAIGVGRMPMSSRDGQRVTTLDAWLPVDWSSPNLTVVCDAQVDRVLLEADRAIGVRLVNGSEIHADRVVLSAGVYGSPAILLRSGIGPAADLRGVGVRVAVDLSGVGANLADHPAVELDAGWRGPETDGPSLHSIAMYRSGLAAQDASPDLLFWLTDPETGDPSFYLDPILLRPRSRGSVRLRSPDPLDAPIIELPRLTDPFDIERLVEGYRRGVEIANRPEMRAVGVTSPPADPGSDDAVRELVRSTVSSIPHTVGTCALGPGPADGAVVDGRGRVHGVRGLVVIDASIIPEPPSGFPHVITIMVAEHLAPTLGDASI
jgi:choline dehydrogenase